MKKYGFSLIICFILLLTACSEGNVKDQDLIENSDSNHSQELDDEKDASDESEPIEKNEETSASEAETVDSSQNEEDSRVDETPKTDLTPITGTSYTIQKGDTLSSIASRANLTIQQLMNWNSIANRSTIFEGQVLNLIAPEDTKNAPKAEMEQENTVMVPEPEVKPENTEPTPQPEPEPEPEADLSPIPDNWEELAREEILKIPGTWWNEYQWYEFEHRNGDIYTIFEVHESGKDGSITRIEFGTINARTIQVEKNQ